MTSYDPFKNASSPNPLQLFVDSSTQSDEVLAKLHAELLLVGQVDTQHSPDGVAGYLSILGENAVLRMDALKGADGLPGKDIPVLNIQDSDFVKVEADLPPAVPDNIRDAYLIHNTTDDLLYIYVNVGTKYNKFPLSARGLPGTSPNFVFSLEMKAPNTDPEVQVYPPNNTGASEVQVHLKIPAKPGPVGPPGHIIGSPDYNTKYDAQGNMIYPKNGQALIWDSSISKFDAKDVTLAQPYGITLPPNKFSNFGLSIDKKVSIANYTIPPQPWPYKYFVWGSMGVAGLSLNLPNSLANFSIISLFDIASLRVPIEIRMGTQPDGQLVGRASAMVAGHASIMPTFADGTNPSIAMDPGTQTGLVPANDINGTYSKVNVWVGSNNAFTGVTVDPAQCGLAILILPMTSTA